MAVDDGRRVGGALLGGEHQLVLPLAEAVYGPLDIAARGKLDLDKIARHWPDIVRVVGSIHTGAVRAYDLVRMLQRDGHPTPLGEAIAHYGRI